MRSYERSGVTVDQCVECRGIFLDRGELERLVDAEQSWHATQRPPQEPSYQPSSHGGRGYGEHSQRRRKKSFFDELFDRGPVALVAHPAAGERAAGTLVGAGRAGQGSDRATGGHPSLWPVGLDAARVDLEWTTCVAAC